MSPLMEYLVYFLFSSLVVAIVCAAIREKNWVHIFREALHFFMMMVVGILGFSGVVFLLEWAFNRQL